MNVNCYKHPDIKANLIAGYSHCPSCARALEREVIVLWVQKVKPEYTRLKIIEVLSEMMRTGDWGFSTFSSLYEMFPRKVHKRVSKGTLGFVFSQKDYIQESFLKFIGGRK